MSACKTGCGNDVDADTDVPLCYPCALLWVTSQESRRGGDEKRAAVAFMDFCNRVRAERQARRPA